MADLTAFRELVPLDHGLCVVCMQRGDGGIASSVVNAGVLQSPLTDEAVVGFVARGLRKLDHIRADPRVTVVIRAGWQWVAVDGKAHILGPNDPSPEIDDEGLRLLLREVFVSAGGTHEDWQEYDRVMDNDRSAAVLVAPLRVYSNPK